MDYKLKSSLFKLLKTIPSPLTRRFFSVRYVFNCISLAFLALCMACLCFVACNSGGGGSDESQGVIPLEGMQYQATSVQGSAGTPLVENRPVFAKGEASEFIISPPLGRSLFNPKTGILSGIPESPIPFTLYTITAKNLVSTASTTIELSVAPLQKFCTTNYYDKKIRLFDKNNTHTAEINEQASSIYDSRNIAFGDGKFAITSEVGNSVTFVDAIKNTILARIPLGQPGSIAFGKGYYAVARPLANSVAIISSDNHEVVANVPTGNAPTYIAFGNNRFAVANAGSNSVTIIDALTHEVLATPAVGTYPVSIAFGNKLFAVSNQQSNSVSILDATTHAILTTITVGTSPGKIAFGNNFFGVVNTQSKNASIILAESPYTKTTYSTTLEPMDIAFGQGHFLTCDFQSNSYSYINTHSTGASSGQPLSYTPISIAFGDNFFIFKHVYSKDITILPFRLSLPTTLLTQSYSGAKEKIAFSTPENPPVFCIAGSKNSSLYAVILDATTDGIIKPVLLPGSDTALTNGKVALGNDFFLVPSITGSDLYLTLIHAKTYESTDLPALNVGWDNQYEIVFGNGYFAVYQEFQDEIIFVNTTDKTTSAKTLLSGYKKIVYGNGYFAVRYANQDKVHLIDTNNIGNDPLEIAVGSNHNPDMQGNIIAYGNEHFAVPNYYSGNITLINTNRTRETHTIPSGANPAMVAYGNKHFAVTNYGEESVTLVNIETYIPSTAKVLANPKQISFGYNKFAVSHPDLISFLDIQTKESLVFDTEGATEYCGMFADNHYIVSPYNSNAIILRNAQDGTVITRFTMSGPVWYDPVYGNQRLLVGFSQGISIYQFITNRLINTIKYIAPVQNWKGFAAYYPGQYGSRSTMKGE